MMSEFDRGEDFSIHARNGGSDRDGVLESPRQAPGVSNEIAREVELAGGGRAHLPGMTWLATARA